MSSTFERIHAKIDRAKQHIQDLNSALLAFRDTNPYAVTSKEDTKAGKRIYYVSKADCVPEPLAAIAADVIHNLRSPLDQIVYQLALAGGATETEAKDIKYPIRDLAAHYPSARGTVAKYVSKDVIDAIDATEPYKGGKGYALWQLNALDIPDKHHLLVGAGAMSSGIDVAVDFETMLRKHHGLEDIVIPPIFLVPADKLLALKIGDELYIEPLDNEVAKNRRFIFEVAFNKPGVIEPEPILKTLHDMTNLVDDIVTNLGRFLP